MKQTNGRKDKAMQIRSDYNLLRRRLNRRHMQWIETMGAIHGEQYRVMMGDQLVDMAKLRPDDVGGFRVTHNFLFQSFRSMVSSALQQEPTPTVALMTSGKDGRQMARACEKLLQYMYFNCEFKDSMRSAISWAFTCGTGFLGCTWDMGSGDPQWVPDTDEFGNLVYESKKELMYDEAGDFVLSPYGTPLTEEVMIPKGRNKMLGALRYWAPSPFDVYPQAASKWSDVRHVTIRQFVQKEELERIYGVEATKHIGSDVRSSDFLRFDSYSDPSYDRSLSHVLVLNYYEKPSMEHEDGRYMVVANDQVLVDDKLPGKQLPVFPVYDMEHPVSIWGESSIKQATEVQRNLNAAETDLWVDRRMHAHPRLICEQGSLVDGPTRVPNTPGAVMQVKSSAKITPHFLSAPSLPRWVEAAPDRYKKAIEDITGAHGITKGDNKGIMSGRQASVILAADRQKWAPTVKSLARATERASELALHLWREYGPAEKTIEIHGENGSPSDMMVFFGHYIPNQVRVRIEVSSMLPYNEEIRRQQVNEAWQIGAIPDLNMYWKLQRHGEMGRLLGTDEPSRSRARMENEILDSGRNAPVEQHEDHQSHLDEHMERMRAPEWYHLPERAKTAYRMHVAQHQAIVENAMNPVLSGASQMPGLTPEMVGGGENLPPGMNSQDQASQPGVSGGLEALMGGA